MELSENHYTQLEDEASQAELFKEEQAHFVNDMLPKGHKVLCIDNSSAPTSTGKKNNRDFSDLPPRLQELFFAIQNGKSREGGTSPLFRAMLGYEPGDERFRVWQPYTGVGREHAKDLSQYVAIIATGSSAMATEYDTTPWMQQMAAVLSEREAHMIPGFFVCFTHQLEAARTGGNVSWMDRRGRVVREFGISTVHANDFRNESSFFSRLPETLVVPASHSQEVVKPPQKGKVTYSNSVSSVQALCYDDRNAWSMQNHPEVLASTILSILGLRKEAVQDEIHDARSVDALHHFGAEDVDRLRDKIIGSIPQIQATREAVFRAILSRIIQDL